jgi:uncharacterized damage-inducible protein DinB
MIRHMNPSTLSRLANQLECLSEVLGSASPEALRRRPSSGKWSVHENLAHLLRHHEITLERMRRILSENEPRFDRYSAEEDSEWPRYAALSTDEVREQLRANRSQLIASIEKLTPEQLARVGIHTRLGALPLSTWLEFFLLHEGHHLYAVFLRARGA